MKYEIIANIGSAIDNVYNNYSEDKGSARKTIAKLKDNCLHIQYQSILRLPKDVDLQAQIKLLESETHQIVSSRLDLIKKSYKQMSNSTLKVSKVSSTPSFETLTISPYSPIRTMLYRCECIYEIKE
jgi:hypothetical protein